MSREASTSDDRVRDLEVGLESLPGADRVAFALAAPGYGELSGSVEMEGAEPRPDGAGSRVFWNAVSPGYLNLFGLEVRAGRNLDPRDGPGSDPVVLVSESFVANVLGGRDPLGRRLRLAGVDRQDWFTVVGIVSDVEMGGGPRALRDRVYFPMGQLPVAKHLILVRSGNPLALAPDLRAAVAAVDPSIPVWSVRTLAEGHAYMTRVPRAMGAMALGGGTAGLLVAAVGLYGLLAFSVRQRFREFGVRLAVGADGVQLAREVLRQAMRQILPAVGGGLCMAWVAAPLLSVALFGGDPRSPGVFLGVAVAFLTAGVGAALLPAIRAARLDAAEVLRGD
jgi:hypothetical protein